MRAMSRKRRNEMAERATVSAACFSRDNHECQAHARGVLADIRCAGRLECNEIIRRSQWTKGYLDLDNTVTLCSAHHHFVTNNPDEARALGFQKKSWERAS